MDPTSVPTNSFDVWVAIFAAVPGIAAAVIAWKAGKRRALNDEIQRLMRRVDAGEKARVEMQVELDAVKLAQELCEKERRELIRENLELYRENTELRRRAG